MAASTSCLLCFSLCALLLCLQGSLAQLEQMRSPFQSQRRQARRGECRLDRLSAHEPQRRVQSEAGVTEYYDEYDEQFRCAGVSVRRRIIEPRGLLLPSYSNAPRLVYIMRGSGVTSTIMPGCPETYQSFRRPEEQMEAAAGQRMRPRDEHQRVQRFREGDIIALPAGVAHWCYNDGDTPVEAITVFDVNNNANQLDSYRRDFRLSGGQQRGQRREMEDRREENILAGFDEQMLAEAMGVSRELVRRLQQRSDSNRGEIVRVDEELRMLRPSRMEEEREREEREEREEEGPEARRMNGLEETMCTMRQKINLRDSAQVDVYVRPHGKVAKANGQKLPMLNVVQMSAERVVLHRNAMTAPHWNMNAHSIMYVTGGRGRCQVVDHRGRAVFDGELRRNQVLVVPQNFAVIERAEREGMEWVTFRTNSHPMVNDIVGKTSAFRAMPVDVLANAYRISREEARRIKFNRAHEMTIMSPRSDERPVAA